MATESFYIEKFPIYAAHFISSDQVLLAGGGGPSKSGYKNRIATYSLSQTIESASKSKERKAARTGEVLLADDEDAPSSLAIHGNLILSGVNESAAIRKKTGDNHHLRSFRLSSSTKASGETNNIKLALEHQIFDDLDKDLDDYQKVTKIKSDGKYAGLLSAEGKLAIVGMSNMTRITSPILKVYNNKFADLDFSEDAVWIASPTKITLLPLPPSKENAESEIFDISRVGVLSKHKISFIRILAKSSALVAFNSPGTGTAYLTLYELYKGSLLQRQVVYISSRITGVYLNPPTEPSKPKSTPKVRVIAVTTSDSNLVLYRSDTLARLQTYKNLHAFPISAVAFSPDSTRLITASIDEKVNVIDLTSLGQTNTALRSVLYLAIFLALYLVFLLVTGGVDLSGLFSGPGEVQEQLRKVKSEGRVGNGPTFEERAFQEL